MVLESEEEGRHIGEAWSHVKVKAGKLNLYCVRVYNAQPVPRYYNLCYVSRLTHTPSQEWREHLSWAPTIQVYTYVLTLTQCLFTFYSYDFTIHLQVWIKSTYLILTFIYNSKLGGDYNVYIREINC